MYLWIYQVMSGIHSTLTWLIEKTEDGWVGLWRRTRIISLRVEVAGKISFQPQPRTITWTVYAIRDQKATYFVTHFPQFLQSQDCLQLPIQVRLAQIFIS